MNLRERLNEYNNMPGYSGSFTENILYGIATEAIEENERLREALTTILAWREYDCPDSIHRCPCALASVEDTARKALEGDQMQQQDTNVQLPKREDR